MHRGYSYRMKINAEQGCIKSVGEEYQVVKKEREYHGCGMGKNLRWKKGTGEVGKGGDDGNFGEGDQDLIKNGCGEEYQVVGNFFHP